MTSEPAAKDLYGHANRPTRKDAQMRGKRDPLPKALALRWYLEVSQWRSAARYGTWKSSLSELFQIHRDVKPRTGHSKSNALPAAGFHGAIRDSH